MTDFFRHYNFFTLALLFALPGLLIWIARSDLHRVIVCVIAFALPFACTEFLFYPTYWEPFFLFDLGRRIGFGIEDIIFVAGLSAFTSTAYAFTCNRNYSPSDNNKLKHCVLRALGIFCFAGILLLSTLTVGIAAIYSTCLVMIAAASVMIWQRPDLTLPALFGGCFSAATYFILCLAAEKIIPGIFKNIWHTDKFLNIFIVGVPVEELIYGFSSGFIATAFYPYVFGSQFTLRKA